MTGLALGMLEQELRNQLQHRKTNQDEQDRLLSLMAQQKAQRQVIEDRITDLTEALVKLRS